ncbi:MAG: 50S ribosomal protein L25 [Myxococcales bacterium]|nr:50S ribosomal protein L25 [Myxococcales bacterium]
MSDTHLEVEAREKSGKGVARKLRAAGRIPAVLYGGGRPAFPLALDPVKLQKLLHASELGMNTLIDLKVTDHAELDGKTVLVRELQRDPVKGSFIHADLYEVDLTHTIEVQVPVHVTGKAVGVEMGGGVLDQVLREVEVKCLPRAIPDELVLDVSALEIGDSLHVRDIALPDGVELISDEDLSVVSVAAPVKEEDLIADTGEEAEVPVVEGEAEGEAPAEGAEGDEAKDKEGGGE